MQNTEKTRGGIFIEPIPRLKLVTGPDQLYETRDMNLPRGSRLLAQFTFTDLHEASDLTSHKTNKTIHGWA